MEQLKRYLKTLPPGPVEKTKELEDLLSSCWDDFEAEFHYRAAWRNSGRLVPGGVAELDPERRNGALQFLQGRTSTAW